MFFSLTLLYISVACFLIYVYMHYPADLLEKVGELIDKLFDLDEELMKCWITSQPSGEKERDGDINLDLSLCLLEAAKQLR